MLKRRLEEIKNIEKAIYTGRNRTMITFDNYLIQQMQDKEFKAEYDALDPEFSIIQAMIEARKNDRLTQKQLAEKTGINQGDISKMENGNGNPSVKTLQR